MSVTAIYGLVWLVGSALLVGSLASAASPEPAAEVRLLEEGDSSPWTLSIQDQVASSPVRSVFVLPGETVPLELEDGPESPTLSWDSEAGFLERVSSRRWKWHAPTKIGNYWLRFEADTGATIQINAFVMVPFKALRGEKINGYRIGKYPKTSPYPVPKGFIEVTEANQDTFVSPHFQIKQFLCKQSSAFPKYLVLQERLIAKLELILDKAHEKGFQWTSFRIMSAYRTPHYNHTLGKRFSRHQYGDAADLMVDQGPQDGRMDDLNRDGRSDVRDSLVLKEIVEEMEQKGASYFPVGGMGVYTRTKRHGSFVHVDARGTSARWGHRGRIASKQRKRRSGRAF